MFNVFGDINWLGVLAAFVASAALAALYFTALVPRYYAAALGRQNAPTPESNLVTNLGPVLCILLTTIASAVLLQALDVNSVGDALVFGAIVGIGYLTAMVFQIAINPNFPRPIYYGLVNAPFFIISSLLASVILELID